MNDLIKNIIVELVPDVITEHTVLCDMDTSHGYKVSHFDCEQKDLTLSVVLRAIKKHDEVTYFTTVELPTGKKSTVEHIVDEWDKEHDIYDAQSPECKAFIGTLLGVTQ